MPVPSFMALALIISEKMTKKQKLNKTLQSQWTKKSRLRLNIDGGLQLYSSNCMPVPSFMALALIISEKMTKKQKLNKTLQSQWTKKSRLRLNIDAGLQLYSSSCMHVPSFMALDLIVSEKNT